MQSPTSALERVFGSGSFFRLWLAMVSSSLGDWVGVIAIVKLSNRVGGSFGIGLTLTARFVPGLFLAPAAGVIVDRFNRKKVMVACDIGRCLAISTLPFVRHLWSLVLASFLLEILTLLWSPAKEASVPNLVDERHLAQVGSLSMVAAYGTFPLAAGAAAVLFKLADPLAKVGWLHALRVNHETTLLYFDGLTFLISAALITSLKLHHKRERHSDRRIDLGQAFVEMREGWHVIGTSPVVRAVMIGMGTGLLGGGLVIPLGLPFTKRVLGAGPAGYSLILFAIGMGAAVGVLLVVLLQKRLPRDLVFCAGMLGAGATLLLAGSMSALGAALWLVGGFGMCAGGVFVLGNTILQAEVDDALRGRIFAAFYSLVRIALVVPMLIGPFLSSGLNRLSQYLFGKDEGIWIVGVHIDLPGVRLTLWLGSLVILGAALLALSAFGHRRPSRTAQPVERIEPS